MHLTLTPRVERVILKAFGIKWAKQAVRQLFAKNFHGYIHFKALKSLVDPEDVEEKNLNSAIQQYFTERKAYDSNDIIKVNAKSHRTFENFRELMDKSYQLNDFIEAIAHKNRDTHIADFNDRRYVASRERP